MKLIIGLGNPGEQYEHTRHNLGFMVVEQFLKDFESLKNTTWSNEEKLKSDIAIIDWQSKEGKSERVILAKPKTYMNNSGMAVSLIASFYKIDPADIWVVHDELDLPVGFLKIRLGGSGAGHHGVESIMQAVGTEKFWRFRMGIGVSRNKEEMANHEVRHAEQFVLAKFDQHETGKLRELIKRGSKAITVALESSLEAAMNQYNTK